MTFRQPAGWRKCQFGIPIRGVLYRVVACSHSFAEEHQLDAAGGFGRVGIRHRESIGSCWTISSGPKTGWR